MRHLQQKPAVVVVQDMKYVNQKLIYVLNAII